MTVLSPRCRFDNFTKKGEFYIEKKIMKKFVKLCLRSSYTMQNSFQFDEIFSTVQKSEFRISNEIMKKNRETLFTFKLHSAKLLSFWRIFCEFFCRSGRWSSFSWSSLYERTTDSSLSWADDELEKETTDKVKALFEKIDHCLYQDGPNENGDDDNDEDERPRTSDSFGSVDRVNPCLSEEMKGECAIWRQRFPHLRYFLNF